MGINLKHKTRILCGASLLALSICYCNPALSNPQDGVVASGSATITESGTKLNIHQNTDRVVIDWRSFDIEVNEHTQFYQPSSSATALNRVNSVDPSYIAGQLSANGNIILINPNGVFFEGTSQVDVNGLIASTADIQNTDFMNGDFNFSYAGNPDASIINEGIITAKDAGLVGLIAPHVENHGIINANLGKVQLASADTYTLDLYGDGLVEIALDDQTTSQFIKNTGSINAGGGTISITAATGKNVVDSLISIEGELKAPTISKKNGKIIIGESHQVSVSGNIDVSGAEDNETGGSITITGDQVAIQSDATLDASGTNGGGTILIGGEYQGGGNTSTATTTYVGNNVNLNASATDNGDGGTVIVWADNRTDYYGTIQAKGGENGGNGGLVETSGKAILNMQGQVDASAENGENGSWLLDPINVTISDAGSADPDTDCGFTCTSEATINITSLETALNGGNNVEIQTSGAGAEDGDITLSNALAWTGSGSLTLTADNDITLDATIDSEHDDANLILSAGGDGAGNIAINAQITMDGDFTATASGGTIDLAANIDTDGGNLTLNSDATASGGSRTLDSNTGTISVQAINAGSNQLSFVGADFDLNGNLTGTNTLNFSGPSTSWSLGIGDSEIASSDADLSDAELDLIQDGFSAIKFGFTYGSSSISVGERTWQDNLQLTVNNNLLTINGNQNVGSNNFTVIGGNKLDLNADLIGTGNLRITGAESLGDDAVSANSGNGIDDTELSYITDGWSSIAFDQASVTIDTAGYEFSDPVTFTGTAGQSITVNDTITAASGSNASFTFRGYSSNIVDTIDINAAIDVSAGDGTGSINFINATTLDIGADLTTAGGNISIDDSVATTNLSSASTLNASSGTITVGTGGIDAGAYDLSLMGDEINITGTLSGTGNIQLNSGTTTQDIEIGSTDTAKLNLTATELAYLQDGWSSITIGGTDHDASFTVNEDITFNDDINFTNISGLSGNNKSLNINANITTTDGSDFTFTSRSYAYLASNITLNVAGNLNMNTPYEGLTSYTNSTINVGGDFNTGRTSFTGTDITVGGNFYSEGWYGIGINNTTFDVEGDITLTRKSGSGTGYNLTISGNSILEAGGDIIMDSSTIDIDSNAQIQSSSGTSSLTFLNYNKSADMEIGGTTQGSTWQLDTDELATIQDGFSNITFGSSSHTGDIYISGAITALDDLNLTTAATGTTYVNNAITQNGNDLVISSGNIELNAAPVITSGNITFANASTLALNADITTTSGNITIADSVTETTIDAARTLNAGTGAISIGAGGIDAGAYDLTLEADDFSINGNLSGSSQLIFNLASNITFGIGDGQTGTASLTNTELDFIQDGFSSINFNVYQAWNSAADMYVGAYTWNDTVNFAAHEIYINGEQNVGANNLLLNGNKRTYLTSNIIGQGNLTLRQGGTGNKILIGSGLTNTDFTDSELAYIQDGWNEIQFLTYNDAIEIDTDYQFSDSVVFTSQGTNILHDTLTAASGSDASFEFYGNTSTYADTWEINAAIDTSSANAGEGSVTFTSLENGLDLNANITTAGGDITIADSVASTTLGAASTLRARTGAISIGAGGIDAGTNNLTLKSDSHIINGALSGTGILSFISETRTSTTMGIGDGTTGTNNFTDTELANITDGWTSISFDSNDSNINIGANTWNDNTSFVSDLGNITISGAQDVGANNLTLSTRRHLYINDTLSGTGTLTIRPTGSSTETLNIGSDAYVNKQSNISDASLQNIQSGWSQIIFRDAGNGTINYDTATTVDWADAIRFQGKTVNINGDFSSTATSGSAVAFNNVTTLNLNANITTGGGDISINSNVASTTLGAASTLNTGTGTITIGAGGIDAGAYDLSLMGDEINITGTLSGTGNIQLNSGTTTQDIEIGSTDTAKLNLTATELAYLQDGWNSITIGDENHTASIRVSEDITFNDNAILRNYNTGSTTDNSIDINANITTTDNSNLSLYGRGNGDSTHPYDSIHLSGGSTLTTAGNLNIYGGNGDVNLSYGDISVGQNLSISAGGNSYLASTNTIAGDVNITYAPSASDRNFNISYGSLVDVNGDFTFTGTNGSFVTSTNSTLEVDGNISIESNSITLDSTSQIQSSSGTSSLTFLNYNKSADMEIGGTTQGSTWQLDADELATIQDGFSNITFGSSSHTGDIYISGAITALDDLNLTTAATGTTYVNNAITQNGNDLVISSGNIELNAAPVITSGNITFANASTLALNTDLTTTSGNITITDSVTETTIDATRTLDAGTGIITIGAGGVSGNHNLTATASRLNIDGSININTNTLNLTANNGPIAHSSGTLTADTINFDASSTITANINAQTNVDIGTNATAANLSGLYRNAATQAVANRITGGPRNNLNYTFENFIIGKIRRDTNTETNIDIPSTYEIMSQPPSKAPHTNTVSTTGSLTKQANNLRGNKRAQQENGQDNDDNQTVENTKLNNKEKRKTSAILGGLITIHPSLAKLLGLQGTEI